MSIIKKTEKLHQYKIIFLGWSLLLAALSQPGDSACFAWAFLVFTAYVR